MLVPDQIDDETIGCLQFVENYTQRYGSPHPEFFQGNLEEAYKEACQKPAKDVRNFLFCFTSMSIILLFNFPEKTFGDLFTSRQQCFNKCVL